MVAAALAVAGAVACAPAAHGQEPGVVYEPGSPSEKEYAIPLEEARNEAGGDRPGREEALAFGIGLSPKGRGSGSGRGSDRVGGGEARGSGGRGAGAQGSRSDGLAERLADAEDAGAPFLWRLGPLLFVLLPALIVAVLLARRDRQGPAAA